jgi:hypothetical protein
MSKKQVKSTGSEWAGYADSNSEGPFIGSHDATFCMAPEFLPGWREFAEGIPIFSQSYGLCISGSLDGSNLKRKVSIPLKPPNLMFRSQSNVSSSSSTLPQPVPFHYYRSESQITVSTVPLVQIADVTTFLQGLPPPKKNSSEM